MSRNGDGALWFCCCCGCVGPIVIAKQIIVLVPFLVMCVGGIMAMGLFFFLKGVPLTVFAILSSRLIGPVVKCLILLALPIPLALYFPVLLIGSTFLALFATVILPATTTMDDAYPLLGGYRHMFRELLDPLRDFWRKGAETCRDIGGSRAEDLRPGETPCEIRPIELFFIIFLWIMALAFVFVYWVLVTAIKYLPCVIRLTIEFWKSFGEKFGGESLFLICFCAPVWCVGMFLIPVFGALVFVFLLGMGLVVSSYTVIVYWQTESIGAAIRYMFAAMYEYDRQTTKFIRNPDSYGNDGCTCFDPCICLCPCCEVNGQEGLFNQEALEYARDLIKIMT